MLFRLRGLLCFYFGILCFFVFGQSIREKALPLKLSTTCDIVIFSSNPFNVKPITKKKYYLEQSFLSFSKSVQVSDQSLLLELVMNDDVLPLEQRDLLLEEVNFILHIDKMGCRKFKNNLVLSWEGQGLIGISLRGYRKRQLLLKRCSTFDFFVSSKGLYRIQLEGDINDCDVIFSEIVVLVL